MRHLYSSLAIGALAVLTVGHLGSASAQNGGSVESGRRLAERACADCHAIGNNNRESDNPLAPSFRLIARSRGVSPIALEVMLTRHHEFMPNLVLSADERANIIAYIETLK